jgi:hypothetical protein
MDTRTLIMWGIFGKNGGIRELHTSKWHARNANTRSDNRIEKVGVVYIKLQGEEK